MVKEDSFYNYFVDCCYYVTFICSLKVNTKHRIKENRSMKGIKIGIVGVCVSLFGIALALNNFFAICGGMIGLLLAIIGCVVKDK